MANLPSYWKRKNRGGFDAGIVDPSHPAINDGGYKPLIPAIPPSTMAATNP
jgi:hypothetical protein